MAPAGFSLFAVPGPPSAEAVSEAGPIVVWMRGEHDLSTVGALGQSLAHAIALGRPSVLLDMSGVTFMSASTLGVIVAAREILALQSRSLSVRSPPVFARRIIAIAALDCLFSPTLQKEHGGAGEPTSSWIAAPLAEVTQEGPDIVNIEAGRRH